MTSSPDADGLVGVRPGDAADAPLPPTVRPDAAAGGPDRGAGAPEGHPSGSRGSTAAAGSEGSLGGPDGQGAPQARDGAAPAAVSQLGDLLPAARVVPRAFCGRDARLVAPELLGKLLVHVGADGTDGAALRAGRIVEAEAYCGSEDPGSHAYRGLTPRNRTMFGPPGRLYVYFTYGMHWCANVVCGDEGEGVAVLLRALAPVAGVDAMWAVRPRARRERDLCSGPAKLCQALGIDRSFDGADLITGDRGLLLCDDGTPPPGEPRQTTRIGLSAGAEHPWRWCVPGDTNVSTRG